MICIEKISWTHLIIHVENKRMPISFLYLLLYLQKLLRWKVHHVRQATCLSRVILCWYTYTTLGARTIMSWYKLQIFSTVHNFINMSHKFTWIINLNYNLVFLFETISLYQLCDKQQSYCICYYTNIVYLLYEYSIFILHVVKLYQMVYIRWEPRKLLELVFKPFVYVMHIYNKICSNHP